MTLEKAIQIRQRQLCGQAVNAVLLNEAIQCIKASHEPLSESQVNEIRRRLGKKGTPSPEKPPKARVRKAAENLSIPVLTQEDPGAVVRALAPWALKAEKLGCA